MGKRCEHCYRPLTDDDDHMGSEELCLRIDSPGNYLVSNCAEFTIKRLRSEVAALRAVVEAAKVALDSAALAVNAGAAVVQEAGFADYNFNGMLVTFDMAEHEFDQHLGAALLALAKLQAAPGNTEKGAAGNEGDSGKNA